MATVQTAHFTPAELNWLQSNLQNFNEEQWTSMGDSDHPIGGGLEHGWFKDFLGKVRICIMNPTSSVIFTDKAQIDFLRKWLIDYKNGAGEYIFKGPYGSAIGEGSQFPSLTGSANSNFNGQGSFPENFYQTGANIFNSILHKLGDVVFPVGSPTTSSPGEV